MKRNIFSPEKNFKIYYYSNPKVFQPTITTLLIIKAINKNKKKFKSKKKILDLGCGSGIIGISIKKKIFKNSKIYFSDLSESAVKLTKKNLIYNNLNCKVKKSNLMHSWDSINFDIIVNDISGISSFFKKKKLWYNKFIPCNSGLDGTKLTLNFLKNFKKKNVSIIIPLISLSNVMKIKKYLKNNKIRFETLLKEDWPLPKKIVNKHLKDLIKFKEKNLINYKEKFGAFIAYTEVLLIKL